MLRTGAADRVLLAQRVAAGDLLAIALCAHWCTTCREFQPAFARLAIARPDWCLLWVDIEDDAALVGDLDVDTFPTLAVFTGATLRHFGPVLPNPALVGRLLADAHSLPARDAPEAIGALIRALLRGEFAGPMVMRAAPT